MATGFHGTEAKLYGAGYELTPFLKNFKISGSRKTYDATALSDLWRIFHNGRASGELTAEGMHSTLATTEFSAIVSAIHGTAKNFMVLPEGNTLAAPFAGIYGGVLGREIKTTIADMVMGVLNVQAKTSVDLGYIAMAHQSTTATVTSVGIDTTLLALNGGAMHWMCTAYSGTAAMYTIKLQDSPDSTNGIDGAWADIPGATTTAAEVVINSGGRYEVAVGETIDRWVRAVATKGASSATASIIVGASKAFV